MLFQKNNTSVNRHEAAANLCYKVPAIQCIVIRTENTVDSRAMSQLIRNPLLEMRGRVNVLNAQIPRAVANEKAATSQVCAHWIDPLKAVDSMHSLLRELILNLVEKYACSHGTRGYLWEKRQTLCVESQEVVMAAMAWVGIHMPGLSQQRRAWAWNASQVCLCGLPGRQVRSA